MSPETGAQGTVFQFGLLVNATAPTGTGMVKLKLCPPKGECNSQDQLTLGFPAGQFGIGLQLDSSGGDQGAFPAGKYSLSIEM